MDQNMFIGYLITKTALKLKNRLNTLLRENGFDITADQFEVLGILIENEGISQSELAYMSSKDKTNITRILDLLEKKNLIVRKKDERDRRAYNIYLTEKGRRQKENLKQLLIKGNQKLSEGLSEKDIREFQRIMNLINGNLTR
ncbi:MAG: MarR family transcriptional regulator [Calditrichaeota bacterium]|nr:MarR family transcriptional regulator [Calditrichota bacterium]